MKAKTKNKGKQNSGGEAKKRAKKLSTAEREAHAEILADQQDHKWGNIGPSGQGSHRGRERRNRQAAASGRPNIGSI